MIDTLKMSHEEYQDHMDKLAHKVGEVLHGERLEDGISACAACIGFAMVMVPPDKHDQMRSHIWKIVDAIIANVPPKVTQ